MKVAFITPTPMLQKFASRSNYHLVLAHIYLQDEQYRNYYKERVAAGDVVLLDNSAYELSVGLQAEDILKCALDLNPTAVFLPDARFDAQKTMQLAEEARKILGGHSWKLLGVPQGKDLKSILECYIWMCEQSWIHGFGLYEEIGEVAKLGSRADFLKYLDQQNLVSPKYYHLLGMEEDLTQIQQLAKFPWVTGIDSAKAVVYGLAGIKLTPRGTAEAYPHRPDGYFELQCPEELQEIVAQNISQVQTWANK